MLGLIIILCLQLGKINNYRKLIVDYELTSKLNEPCMKTINSQITEICFDNTNFRWNRSPCRSMYLRNLRSRFWADCQCWIDAENCEFWLASVFYFVITTTPGWTIPCFCCDFRPDPLTIQRARWTTIQNPLIDAIPVKLNNEKVYNHQHQNLLPLSSIGGGDLWEQLSKL